jgi:hypothetical protein
MALVLTIGVGAVAAAGPRGGPRQGPLRGPVAGLPQVVPGGTLTPEQSAALAGMAEEEKVAQDLYAAFAAMYPSPVWDAIGAAESTHLAAIRSLLARYGIADPTAGRAAGSFASPAAGTLYADLLAQGSVSEIAAFGVGRTVELDDIAKLDAARAGLTAPDVLRVYGNLRNGSTHHFAAFSRLLGI